MTTCSHRRSVVWLLALAAGTSLCARVSGQGCPPTFAPPLAATSGSSVYSVSLGDLNNDGLEDILTANSGSGSIFYWLAQPNGTFLPSVALAASGSPTCAIGANVTGGPLGDIVAANFNANTLTIWPDVRQTVPPPGAPFTVAAGSGPFWVQAGDVSGDGRLDLVVANFGAASVSVLLGKADGTFEARRTLTTPSATFSVCIADFDLDGKKDIATANYNTASVSVLRSLGAGNFAAPQTYAAQQLPRSICAADLNNDGRPDIAVANNGSSSVSVLIASPDSGFLPSEQYALTAAPQGIAAGDLNNDGWIDLAIAMGTGNSVSVLAGFGGGRFRSAVTFAAGSQPTSLAIGDVNRDGAPDVEVANFGGEMSRLFNTAPQVRFEQQPRNLRLWDGVGGALAATVTAPTGSQYRWFKGPTPVGNDGVFNGATTPALGFSPNAPADLVDGLYRLEVSNACGRVYSEWAYVSKTACAVDLNNSGTAGTEDLFLFLDRWYLGCP